MPQNQEVTEIIVRTVADREKSSPSDLPPLDEKIDSETLYQLENAESRLTEPVEFTYLFYQITVQPNGEVIVT